MSPYLTVLHRDDDIIVLNKPSGLLSVTGNRPSHKDALSSRVQRVFPTASVVHRLDWATSGVIVMAMHKAANRSLSHQFHHRITHKRYFARVHGIVSQQQGSIDLPLSTNASDRPTQRVDTEQGKPSLTHYTVLHTEDNQWGGESWVELRPVTGRSHQLRVHMQAIGHPIMGDRLYAHSFNTNGATSLPRLQLHAETLILRHPRDNSWQRFCAAIPFLPLTPTPLGIPE
ncbi:pseudouridine synthase [Alteromonas gilva]|uniref:Dual-specificity RNA pseudouridine synthase RluA n=1 Tax=Alteromonas gilva TaxID=2987522 RepID=A0ABT5L6E3_9ALTE|nr:pseudouridine synthase [Alteromonas gilva]MDC8832427.1 pseudouridine synthase [Alteromonas gilva]